MTSPFLSVVVPAYNEAAKLPDTLRDIRAHLNRSSRTYEIIVVDDGSGDPTPQVIRSLGRTMPELLLVENAKNRGKGAAVREGMRMARGEYRLFTDADNSTSISEFDRFLPYLENGYDIVFASRGLKESKLSPPSPFARRLFGKMGNFIIQSLILSGIRDTQCGFKVFRGEAAERIFKLSRIDRWGFDIEVLALAKKLGYKLKEAPVTWAHKPESSVYPLAYLQTLRETLKIRWWLSTDAYGVRAKRNARITHRSD